MTNALYFCAFPKTLNARACNGLYPSRSYGASPPSPKSFPFPHLSSNLSSPSLAPFPAFALFPAAKHALFKSNRDSSADIKCRVTPSSPLQFHIGTTRAGNSANDPWRSGVSCGCCTLSRTLSGRRHRIWRSDDS